MSPKVYQNVPRKCNYGCDSYKACRNRFFRDVSDKNVSKNTIEIFQEYTKHQPNISAVASCEAPTSVKPILSPIYFWGVIRQRDHTQAFSCAEDRFFAVFTLFIPALCIYTFYARTLRFSTDLREFKRTTIKCECFTIPYCYISLILTYLHVS